MRLLYLIRHATPVVQPDMPSREWTLSERGIDEAGNLAAAAGEWELAAIYSGSEPKMRGTALVIADAASLDVRVADAFDELRIPHWIPNSDEFNELVQAILEEGAIARRGIEPAAAAADRFAAGVELVAEGPFPAAIISGGRILTAWLTRTIGLEEPFETWRNLPMPGYACIDLDAPQVGFIVPFRV